MEMMQNIYFNGRLEDQFWRWRTGYLTKKYHFQTLNPQEKLNYRKGYNDDRKAFPSGAYGNPFEAALFLIKNRDTYALYRRYRSDTTEKQQTAFAAQAAMRSTD
jgi:3',5'-cyclic-nucleotide phosphodiesterase